MHWQFPEKYGFSQSVEKFSLWANRIGIKKKKHVFILKHKSFKIQIAFRSKGYFQVFQA